MKNLKVLIFLFIFLSISFSYANEQSNSQKYYEARNLIKNGLLDNALEKLSEIDKDYVLFDYVLWDIAYCAEKTGNVEKAVEVLKDIVDNYKDSSLFRKSLKNLITLTSDSEKKIQYIESYLRKFPDDYSILFEKAKILKNIGKISEANKIFKKIFVDGDEISLKAFMEIEKIVTIDDIYMASLNRIKKNDIDGLYKLLKKMPENDSKTLYLYGLYYFKRKEYLKASKFFEKINYEDSKKLYLLSLLRAKDYSKFFQSIDDLVAKYERNIYDLVYSAGDRKRRDGDLEGAIRYFNYLLEKYPEKNENTVFGMAWLYLTNEKLDEAKKYLETLIKDDEIIKKDKYYFWLGKIEELNGRDGSVYYKQIEDKESFYYLRIFPYKGEKNSMKLIEKDISQEVSKILKRIEEMKNLDMKKEAVKEMGFYYEQLSFVPDIFAKYLFYFEDYSKLVKLGIQKNNVLYKYPIAFGDIVFSYSKKYEVDPFLVLAIMREESHFKPDIISNAGACGLMQLMPFTAKKVGSIDSRDALFKEEINISLGIKYISELLKKYKNLEYAISAYNAGENAVDLWLTKNYKDLDFFIEDIPYSETRNYVKKVLRTYYILKGLYKNNGEMAKNF